MENATYSDERLGYELQFRPALEGEYEHVILLVFDLVKPDSERLWGTIERFPFSPNYGALHSGCDRPNPGSALTAAQKSTCRVWYDAVYALDHGRIDSVPGAAQPAPGSLILVGVGAVLVDNWSVKDQFFFKECAK